MKKRVLSIVLMLVGMTAWAQNWTGPSENDYPNSTPVYVKVNYNGGVCQKAIVAAFIDGECRAVSYGAEAFVGGETLHLLRVWGDLADEKDKDITFKVDYAGIIYAMNPTIPFTGETYQTIPLEFNIECPTGVSLTNPLDIVAKLTYEYDLTNDIKFSYEGYDDSGAPIEYTPKGECVMETPLTFEWNYSGSEEYFTVKDKTLIATKATGDEMAAYLSLNIPELGLSARTRVNISEPLVPVEGITCLPSKWETQKGDFFPRTEGLYEAITVLPEDASNKAYRFEPANDATAAVYQNNVFTAGGTYLINIVSEADPTKFATIEVTVKVPVENISLTSPTGIFFAVPGNNVFDIIRPYVSVYPDDATNKNFSFNVTAEASDAIIDGEAIRAGTYFIYIESDENNQISERVQVIVNEIMAPEVIEMKIGENYNAYLDEVTILPNDNPDYTFTYSVTISSPESFKDDGTALTAGDYLLTIICNENTKAKAEVVVRVAEPVVITFPSSITLSKFKDTELELTLVSGAENFDPELLEFLIEPMGDMAPGSIDLISYTPIENTNNLAWNLRAHSVGRHWIQVLYDEEWMMNEDEYEGIEACVPVEIPFNNNDGWDWVYIPTDMNLIKEDGNYQSWMNQDANNRIIEIRSQTNLLYNDTNYGLFGTIDRLSARDGMYKVKALYENAEDAVFVGDVMEIWWDRYPWKEIVKGYNWIGYPNEWDMTVADLNTLGNVAYDGDQIIGKTGFAEYDAVSGEWVANGDFYFQAGKGYLYYCTDEEGMPDGFSFDFTPTIEERELQQSVALAAQETAAESVWQYDAGQFADNMAIVAEIPQLDFPADYTVGAFVGDECRGKGSAVQGGKMMISVAGKAGERVTFRLHNELTGEFIDLNETLTYAQRAGSLKKPVVLTSEGIATSIAEKTASEAAVEGIFDLSGRRVENMNAGGIYIIKTLENGKIAARKVIK